MSGVECVGELELDLILEAIYRRHGYDFRNYARASLKRRLEQRRQALELPSLGHMLPRILHDEGFFEQLFADISISVTRMFRDPHIYRAIRQKVIPILKTYPYVKIWHAGCSTGEEVYSMAIVLHEEGFLERAHIYATDFNNRSLAIAREGIYSLEAMREATQGYVRAGGTGALIEHYRAHYESAIFHRALRQNITFSHHNLVTDGVFGEMNLIVCRNVLIYFDCMLQERVLGLFRDSLCPRGFLCLGSGESLALAGAERFFEAIDEEARLYRLRLPGGGRQARTRSDGSC